MSAPRAKGRKGPRKGLRAPVAVALALLLSAAGVGLLYFLDRPAPDRPPVAQVGEGDLEGIAEEGLALSLKAAARSEGGMPGKVPVRPVPKTLVLIVDDAGYSLDQLEAFLELPFPLTIAVLPRLPHSAEAGRRVLAAGKELILHQPMEAEGGQNPGPGAIFADMEGPVAAAILGENLDSLPGARGFNNHMGSAVTRLGLLMGPLMELAKARGIYYVDSLTAPDTVTKALAHDATMKYWERSVFLDNSPDRASIIRAVAEGKKKAESGFPAIMIGHVWSADLAATLASLYPALVEEGYSLSTISRLMIEEADARTRD